MTHAVQLRTENQQGAGDNVVVSQQKVSPLTAVIWNEAALYAAWRDRNLSVINRPDGCVQTSKGFAEVSAAPWQIFPPSTPVESTLKDYWSR